MHSLVLTLNLISEMMLCMNAQYLCSRQQARLGIENHDRLINEYPKGSYRQKHYCDKGFIIILIEIRRRCLN
jgi:hypothetical protein